MEERPPEPAWLFYVLSFAVPVAGIVIGVIYLAKADEGLKRFGKTCLIFAAIPIALLLLFILAVIIVWVLYVLIVILVILVCIVYYLIIMVFLLAVISSIESAITGVCIATL
ncbi:MAG: hypothetical protein JSW52_08185 [Candidatus Coatesbacteria bacterium]|nr:MAG: hypothetical protein JSW52_08185 [Candidatus Coatesbacteria bacterium]